MRPEIKPADWDKAKAAVLAYGKARKIFCAAQAKLQPSGLLCGNDNKVGAAGEFWAKRLFHREGWQLTSIEASNNEGFDFCCSRDTTTRRISVKVISDESESGKQMPLKARGTWDELVVVLLTRTLVPYRYGRATWHDFERAHKDGAVGNKPKVSRSWLQKKGWISRYGKVEDW